MSGLPASAPVVVIGAGCIGTSIAYELGRRGVKGVVVVEKELFAGTGSTAKAAGGIRAQFSTPLNVRLSMMSVARFKTFAEEMDTDPVFFPVGYLFLLGDPDLWATFQRQADMQRSLGLPVQTLTPAEAKGIVPELHVDDLLGATFCLDDGLGDPDGVTQAYVAQARRLGAAFRFAEPATGLVMEGDRVTGVRTAAGTISTPVVVNAAGPHAREVAGWAGVDLPRLAEFILPGGSRAAALAHVCRAVCRRAERAIVTLGKAEPLNAAPRQYVNRLSDLLFVLARVLNRFAGGADVQWQQRKNQ